MTDTVSASSTEPVTVIGLGAVGTVLAGSLAAAGHQVTACSRSRLDHVELTDDTGTRSYPVRGAAGPEDVEPTPWVFLATKIHQTADAADWLRAATDASSRVVVAQNGVDHEERVAGLVGAATVVPTLVYLNAERTGVGAARARNTGDRDLVVPDDPDGRATAALCGAAALRVDTQPDFLTAAWRKLLANAVGNPITALTGRRSEVLGVPAVADLATIVLREAVAVGRAVGADLPDDCVDETLAWLHQLAPGTTSSMLQDREAGRPLEYDGLTGTIVRLGDRHGIHVDANRMLLALLANLAL